MSRTYRPSKHSQLCDTLLRPHYIDRTSDLHLFHMQGRRHAIVEVVQIHLTEYVVILELQRTSLLSNYAARVHVWQRGSMESRSCRGVNTMPVPPRSRLYHLSQPELTCCHPSIPGYLSPRCPPFPHRAMLILPRNTSIIITKHDCPCHISGCHAAPLGAHGRVEQGSLHLN